MRVPASRDGLCVGSVPIHQHVCDKTLVWMRYLCSTSKDESSSEQRGGTVLPEGRAALPGAEKDPRAEPEVGGLGSEVSHCLCSDISPPYGSHQQNSFF